MDTNQTVRLLRNRLYPTFQLYAVMGNKKTAPQEGLKLGALTVMHWLAQRLGENVPPELQRLPGIDDYKAVPNDRLCSLHLSSGFVIDIVSMPDQGIWSLQLTEPDLGSEPGKEDQARQAVPGRVFETNIGFFVSGGQLECGFQTIVSDPEGTEREADVYRLAVIRRLILHRDFGLRQITPLGHDGERITTVEKLKNLCQLWRDEGNQLPCMVFTHLRRNLETPESLSASPPLGAVLPERKVLMQPTGEIKVPKISDLQGELPYDGDEFARKTAAFCRIYAIEDKLLERFAEAVRQEVRPGDIIVLEPKRFGGKARVLPYKPSQTRKQETMDKLLEVMCTYPRGKEINFGNVKFLSQAREALLLSTTDALRQSADVSLEWEQKMIERDGQWQSAVAEKEDVIQTLTEQLERQKVYQVQLERELEKLRQDGLAEAERWKAVAGEAQEQAQYLRRKLDQPDTHGEVAAWVQKHFPERLILHPKAVSLLEDRSAQGVDVKLICDALDFLATDYWARRYEQISTEEMNTRCAEKYGRPFGVKPTGEQTVKYKPSQYKIKYFPGIKGKPVESPLDYHLGVGNDPENLLRIYFLHDDEKKLIVVGSLPRHLQAVTIS